MTGHSIYGLSKYGFLFWVTLATYFSPLFFLHWYSQVTTICMFSWEYPVKLFLGSLHRAISHPNTGLNYRLSYYITELHPILIHYQTIFYRNILPNYTFS